MAWEVEFTDEFGPWWGTLGAAEQDSVDVVVRLLEERGPNLPFPFSSALRGSRHGHMRELRIQHGGRPIRVLYAFDPRRIAILLIGGDKSADHRWYDRLIPAADALYDAHLKTLGMEGGEDG